METVWFVLIAVMLAAYVVLDGFDIGVGIVHPFVARTEAERRLLLKTIGPVWDGNEVWLIGAGGGLVMAFPALYASSFSGFFLPLMIVLWLLMGRGIALVFRNEVDHPAWRPFWDVVFSVSSALLAVSLGAALGNVIRGVPMDASGLFFEPLWTDFGLGPPTGIVDWFTFLVGLLALSALALHGSLWAALKTEDELARRARAAARLAWGFSTVLAGALTFLSFRVQPWILARIEAHPGGLVFPLLGFGGLVGARWFSHLRLDRGAFLASSVFLVGLLASTAFGLYPFVLPRIGSTGGLTVWSAAAGEHGLRAALWWWIPGMAFVVAYFVILYRSFAGKVRS